jgi:hypothetical protein
MSTSLLSINAPIRWRPRSDDGRLADFLMHTTAFAAEDPTLASSISVMIVLRSTDEDHPR